MQRAWEAHASCCVINEAEPSYYVHAQNRTESYVQKEMCYLQSTGCKASPKENSRFYIKASVCSSWTYWVSLHLAANVGQYNGCTLHQPPRWNSQRQFAVSAGAARSAAVAGSYDSMSSWQAQNCCSSCSASWHCSRGSALVTGSPLTRMLDRMTSLLVYALASPLSGCASDAISIRGCASTAFHVVDSLRAAGSMHLQQR